MENNTADKQPLFKGQATYSKELLKEFTASALKKTWTLIWVFTALTVLTVFTKNGVMISVTCIAEIMMLFLVIYQKYIIPKNLYAMTLEENKGAELTNSVDIFEDEIILTNRNAGNKFTYPFSLMRRVIETKNLVIITSKAKLNIILEKSKFELGNKDTLIMFVKSKIAGNPKN